MLYLLYDLQVIYVDGTFKVCPRMFTQLFIINGFVHGQQFICLATIQDLSGLQQDVYLPQERLQNRSLQMSSQGMMADF